MSVPLCECLLCGGVSVHVCAACGCETHIVCVISLNSVKIAHRWKFSKAVWRERASVGFDVDGSLYGNLAPVHCLSTNDSSAGSLTLTVSLNTGSKYK